MATTMTENALTLVTDAFQLIGVVAKDEAAQATDLAYGIRTLNRLLKAEQNSAITIWKQTTGTITVTNATASYTVTGRPLSLSVVNWKESGGIESPMLELTRKEYYELPSKTSAGRASQYYYHRGRETGTLFVWPVLATAAGETIEWSGTAEADDITAGGDTVDAPVEWYEAIVYTIGERLIPAYPSVTDKTMALVARNAPAFLAQARSLDREPVYFQPDFRGRP